MAAKLKHGARVRKGRGFVGASNTILEENEPFERVRSHVYEREKTDGFPERSVEGWSVFVTGIHQESIEDDLKEVFSDFGRILNIHANLDRRTGYLKGYAIIEYSAHRHAADAIEHLNGTEFLGQILDVSWCFVKPQI